ncbi:hypothetical protein AB4876_16810 [Zhongshania guokunii]|uniref:Uncharacterized protein n=1 Tax=Zhongshania guokunii TaxID=641783 RepID=A0ABV3UD20_9GAMM
MKEEWNTPKATAQQGGGDLPNDDSAFQEESLALLSTACSDYLDSYITLAQLHGQRFLLSLCKMFLLWVATLILLLAAWCSGLLALYEVAVIMGAPPVLAMLVAALCNLAMAWWCWRRMCSRLHGFAVRTRENEPTGVNKGASNGN